MKIDFACYLHREYLFAFEVGGNGLGLVDLCHRACQHILVDQQEVGIFAREVAARLE